MSEIRCGESLEATAANVFGILLSLLFPVIAPSESTPAYRAAGLTPVEEPIRSGTDGARLSVRGLPCPNVFTGGMNFHGVFECLPVKSLEKAAGVAAKLAELSASVKSLA